MSGSEGRHAPRGCHAVTGGRQDSVRRCISAASSASARFSQKIAAAGTPDMSGSEGRHAPRGCHAVTGGKQDSVRRCISAASSASARFSQKIAAAGTPDMSGSEGRHAPRGCHAVTGGKRYSAWGYKKKTGLALSFFCTPMRNRTATVRTGI